ncbi:cation:dicarboxylate symporter family transporter [Peptostreptococcus russellii]|uniref:cation:dicarboxylate symporter family transporter n=1 Tax=Peptostreptococcus russellii TaxID=215200 RepID=UPI0026EFB167|nr:cation:dicarboxylase symporter family transporter [Peptostreptococcus russellii]
MKESFLKDFLMISNFETVGFLILLAIIFFFIAKLIKRFDYSKLVMIGTVLGILLGLIIQIVSGFAKDPMKISFVSETTKWYSLFGGGYIDIIRMLVIPLIIISIIHVIINMDMNTNISKLTKYTLLTSMTMLAISAIVGFTLAYFYKLGASSAITGGKNMIRETHSVVDTFRNILPANPFQAMLDFNVIAIVIASVIVGVSARSIRKNTDNKLESFTKLIDDLHKIISNMADMILGFMPFAVVPLLANTIAQNGIQAIKDVIAFIIILYISIIIMLIIQSIALLLYGVNPIWYFKNALSTLVLAFTSRSSVGVLPSTITSLSEKLDVDDATASFVASFSATAGMQGCAGIYPAMLIVFVANTAGVPIDFSLVVTSIIVVTIGSIGIAGIPGTSITAASVSISGVGMSQYFALVNPILAIDPLLDMGRTMLNVSGAMTNAIIVEKKIQKNKR